MRILSICGAICIAMAALGGCAANQSKANLDLISAAPMAPNSTTGAIADEGNAGGTYADDSIEVIWGWTPYGLAFALKNVSDQMMRLIWDEASIVIGGMPHRVIHNGIVFVRRDQPMVPTVIPPGSTVADSYCPSDYVQYIGSDWSQAFLFKANDGPMDLQAYLPLESEGKRMDYNFQFRWAPVETP